MAKSRCAVSLAVLVALLMIEPYQYALSFLLSGLLLGWRDSEMASRAVSFDWRLEANNILVYLGFGRLLGRLPPLLRLAIRVRHVFHNT